MKNIVYLLGLLSLGISVFATAYVVNAQSINAPSGLSASYTQTSRAQLSWIDNATNEAFYVVERSANAGGSWTRYADLHPNSTSFDDTYLSCGANYQYRVRAYGSGGYSAYSNTASVSISCSVQAPSNLGSSVPASQTALDFLTLQWTDNSSNETAFFLETSSGEQVAELPANTMSYLLEPVSCYGHYNFRVRAYNSITGKYSLYSYTNNYIETGDCTHTPESAICTFNRFVTDEPVIPSSVQISGNGSRVVAQTAAGLEIFDVNTAALLSTIPNVDGAYSVSDNGQKIVFASHTNLTGQNTDLSSEFFLWNNGAYTQLSNDPDGSAYSDLYAVISGDGSTVIFTSHWNSLNNSQAPAGKVFLYRWRQGSFLSLVNSQAFTYSVGTDFTSSDNGNLVFFWHDGNLTGQDASHQGMIYRKNFSTGIVTGISTPALKIQFIRTNADASRLVGASNAVTATNPDGNRELFLWNATDGWEQLTETTSPYTEDHNDHVLASIDDSGSHILFTADFDLTGENSTGGSNYRYYGEYFFYNAESGISQVSNRNNDWLYTYDGALSDDGHRAALLLTTHPFNPTVTSYYRIYIAECPSIALAPPSNLQAALDASEINLTWTDNATGEDGYALELSTDGGADWDIITEMYGNTTSSTATYMPCGTTLLYRVQAWRDIDQATSRYSNVASVTTPDCSGLPAPSNLSISTTTATSIRVTWQDNSSTESNFRLQHSSDGGSTWTETPLSANTTSYTNTNLVCGTSYRYRISAYRISDSRYSSYSNVLTASTQTCPMLAAPSKLVANNVQQQSISLQWQDNTSGESGYQIGRTKDGVFTELAVIAANSTSYTDNTAVCSNNYQYSVRAWQPGGNNNYSNSATLPVSSMECMGLTAPIITTSSRSSYTLSFSWADNATVETAYYVEAQSGENWTILGTLSANSTSYTASVACNAKKSFRIRAYNQSSDLYSFYTLFVGTSAYCPPSNFQASNIGVNSMNFSWTNNNNPAPQFNHIESSLTGQNNWTELAQLPASSSTANVTTLVCGTSYDFRISAIKVSDNNVSDYVTLSRSTASCSSVYEPSGLTIGAATEMSISLSWTDNANDEANYKLERSVDGINWIMVTSLPANTTSYVNTGLNCGTGYTYRLQAYRSTDNSHSAYSNTASSSTLPCPVLNAPVNIQFTANSSNSLSLSWQDNSNYESGYQIERSINGEAWQLIATLGANSQSYTNSNLECQTAYSYRIRSYSTPIGSYGAYGQSLSGNTATCPALLASVLSSTATSTSSISLDWTVDTTATSFTLWVNNGVGWTNLANFSRSSHGFTHNNLACGRSYQYRLQTYRLQDNATLYSSSFTASTATCEPLVAPSVPVVLNTDIALVSLQIPIKPAGANSLLLQRSIDGTNWQVLGNVSGNYIDVSVDCGQSYQYRLLAVRGAEESPASLVASANTDACPTALASSVGVYQNGRWLFKDSNGNVSQLEFGSGTGWQAIAGDWDGDGLDGIGLYKDGLFILRDDMNGAVGHRFNYGNSSGWQAIAGDWDGDGVDSVGLFMNGLFVLSNDNTNDNYRFNLGNLNAGQPVAGDWDGNGADSVGIYYRGNWQLTDNLDAPTVTRNFAFGPDAPSWYAISGDWDGDGVDGIGIYGYGSWRLRATASDSMNENIFLFGDTAAGWLPIASSPYMPSTPPNTIPLLDDDEDGLSNVDEATYGTNAQNPDSDNDGLNDGDEVHNHETNPSDADSDDDNLSDGEEIIIHGTNPNNANSDGDDMNDDVELSMSCRDPLDATDNGANCLAAPTANFSYSCVSLVCNFISSSTDADGMIVSYVWDFTNDGISDNTAQNPGQTFASSGNYSVRLTVTDNNGLTNSITKTVSVTAANVAPTAYITQTCVYLVCDFSGNLSSDSDGTIMTYNWDFGDWYSGSDTATGAAATHTFTAAGSYSVSLNVTDDDGATHTAWLTVTATTASDTDGDTLPDDWELLYYTPVTLNDQWSDDDFDDCSQECEYNYGLDPFNPDTDADGMMDGWELPLCRDPNNASPTATLNPCPAIDTDGEGLADHEEINGFTVSTTINGVAVNLSITTDPLNPDSDGDGLDDYEEARIFFTDPMDSDTDGDGINDGDDANPLN